MNDLEWPTEWVAKVARRVAQTADCLRRQSSRIESDDGCAMGREVQDRGPIGCQNQRETPATEHCETGESGRFGEFARQNHNLVVIVVNNDRHAAPKVANGAGHLALRIGGAMSVDHGALIAYFGAGGDEGPRKVLGTGAFGGGRFCDRVP